MPDNEDETKVIGPGYAFSQLVKALRGTSELAQKRVEQWQNVIAGIIDGSLDVGSRTPVGSAPPWVTLDVVHGGFATGGFAAAGPLKTHEKTKFASLHAETTGAKKLVNEATTRGALNLFYNSEPGQRELRQMLSTGNFRIDVPEEAALLITAWLAKEGQASAAESLLETLAPFFNQLRFYPIPAARPARMGSGVYVMTAGDCVRSLQSKRPNTRILIMKESNEIWAPLFDRAVNLFLETIEGETPAFKTNADGKLERADNGQPIVTGGWPCKNYSSDWAKRASALLSDQKAATGQHSLSKKPQNPRQNLARLLVYLEKAASDPEKLTGRDVGMIRKILAACASQHGLPGSERLQRTRDMQASQVRQPLHHVVAKALAARLSKYPPDEGVADIDSLFGPLNTEEAADLGICSGDNLPRALTKKAVRCLDAPLKTLVERKLVPSSEVMAKLLPAVTGSIRAFSIADPELARAFATSYSAFRRRRSLLLLNLASQVRFEELPWIASVSRWTGADDESRAAARGALVQAATIAIEEWPQTITPNDLVKEMRMLAKSADITLPLVDELAADIFMGTFTLNFLRAAQEAGRLLSGSLYERYYGIDYAAILALDSTEPKTKGPHTSPQFDQMCKQLSVGTQGGQSFTALNGTIIEQAQILTTHNLASLFNALELKSVVGENLEEQAQECFQWICRRLQNRCDWRAELQGIKNSAYAWRQMLFYVSLLDPAQQEAFMSWCTQHLRAQITHFRTRLSPAMKGLELCIQGGRFDADGTHSDGGRRFLGWTTERHWLRGPDERKLLDG